MRAEIADLAVGYVYAYGETGNDKMHVRGNQMVGQAWWSSRLLVTGTIRNSSIGYSGFFGHIDETTGVFHWSEHLIDRTGSKGFAFNCVTAESSTTNFYVAGYRFDVGVDQDMRSSNKAFLAKYSSTSTVATQQWFKQVQTTDETSVQLFLALAQISTELYGIFYHQVPAYPGEGILMIIEFSTSTGAFMDAAGRNTQASSFLEVLGTYVVASEIYFVGNTDVYKSSLGIADGFKRGFYYKKTRTNLHSSDCDTFISYSANASIST